jgi:hypothetical protein
MSWSGTPNGGIDTLGPDGRTTAPRYGYRLSVGMDMKYGDGIAHIDGVKTYGRKKMGRT